MNKITLVLLLLFGIVGSVKGQDEERKVKRFAVNWGVNISTSNTKYNGEMPLYDDNNLYVIDTLIYSGNYIGYAKKFTLSALYNIKSLFAGLGMERGNIINPKSHFSASMKIETLNYYIHLGQKVYKFKKWPSFIGYDVKLGSTIILDDDYDNTKFAELGILFAIATKRNAYNDKVISFIYLKPSLDYITYVTGDYYFPYLNNMVTYDETYKILSYKLQVGARYEF